MVAEEVGAPALCAAGCVPGKAWTIYHATGVEGGGADRAEVPVRLRPHFGGCERGRPPLAAAVQVHTSAFWAAVRASGAASRPELSPPLYGSVIFTCGFLRLRPLMHSVAGGSGDNAMVGRGLLHCRFAPIHSAVSVHVP